MQQKSIAPLVCGIIGAVLSLPNLLCASACGAVVAGAGAGGAGASIFVVGIIPVIAGFISAFLSRTNGVAAGVGFMVSAVFSMIFLIMTAFSDLFTWAALILFIIAGILSFVQKTNNPVNMQ